MADWIGVDVSHRTCTIDGCERKHCARGLCSMHWKREYGKRTKYRITCVTCGVEWMSDRPDGKFCSDHCKGEHYARTKPPTRCKLPADHPVVLAIAAEAEALRARRARERRARRSAQREERLRAWRTPRECPGCGCVFSPLWTPTMTTCSRRCVKRLERRKRRLSGRHLGWVWSEFQRIVTKFDGRCAYCGERSERVDPDHVVPLSRGGADSVTNLLPACLSCNSSKGARLLHEWAAWRAERGLEPRVTTWELDDPRFVHLTHALLVAV